MSQAFAQATAPAGTQQPANVIRLGVVLERRPLDSRWADHAWSVLGVVPACPADGVARCIVDDGAGHQQWLHGPLELRLTTDEAGHYLANLDAPEPSLFVLWRPEETPPQPVLVSASHGEAARWLDGGGQVDRVALPAELRGWLESFARCFHRPEVRRKGGRFASSRNADAPGH